MCHDIISATEELGGMGSNYVRMSGECSQTLTSLIAHPLGPHRSLHHASTSAEFRHGWGKLVSLGTAWPIEFSLSRKAWTEKCDLARSGRAWSGLVRVWKLTRQSAFLSWPEHWDASPRRSIQHECMGPNHWRNCAAGFAFACSTINVSLLGHVQPG